MHMPRPTRFATYAVRGLAAACLLCAVAGSPAASAQSMPGEVIRLIVPYPPGGGDILARMVMNPLQEVIHKRIIVENKPGADGLIGAELVRRASPDGKTLLFATNTQMAGMPALHKEMPYDPNKDFTPVSLIGVAGFFLFVSADIPAKSVPELVKYAQSRKGKPLACGTSNITSQFAMLQLITSQHFDCTQAQYRGDGAALPALVTHDIDMLFATVTSAKGLLAAGKIRMLATTLQKRSDLYPDVPTLEEVGVPGIQVSPFIGIFGPAHMPKNVTDELGRGLQKVLAQPALRQQLTDQAVAVDGRPGEALKKVVAEQLDIALRVVRENNLPRQ